MQRLNLAWFAELGTALNPIADLSGTLTVFQLFQAREYLKILADERSLPLSLKASRPVIRDLIFHLDAILGAPAEQHEKLIDARKFQIVILGSKLGTLLSGELSVQPTYHVWPKRAYDIDILVTSGEQIFAPVVQAAFNDQETYDVQQAGKCLAFEIPTAAAFHLFRAAESVLRRYYEVVVGTLPKPKMRNWGVYIKNLRAAGADPIVLSTLEQIKELHRNPVIHPETRMQTEEALSLVGVLESAVSAMMADMHYRRSQAIPPTIPGLDAIGAAAAS